MIPRYRSIISYADIIKREEIMLQRGMNFRIKPNYSVILMSVIYPYPLSRQKLEVFKVDSSPSVKAVGTEGARRATGVPT
ncbi:MAG: hypothetical protein ACYS19_13135, partial [Planctomycetota bacterium]